MVFTPMPAPKLNHPCVPGPAPRSAEHTDGSNRNVSSRGTLNLSVLQYQIRLGLQVRVVFALSNIIDMPGAVPDKATGA